MSVKQFRLPDLGEGLTESELVSWKVAVGDPVELNQIVAEVETAKALVELPSPYAGIVSKLYEEPGATIQVGSPILAFDVDDGETSEPEDDTPPDAKDASASSKPERNAVLVGYGPAVETGKRPTRKKRSSIAEPSNNGSPVVPVENEPRVELVERPPTSNIPGKITPRSTPPVRALARDLGVNLSTLTGSGEGGIITRDDVESAASAPEGAPAPSRESGERETRTPIRGVRKHTAEAMVASAFTAPHVTEFLTVDVTETMQLIDSLKAKRAFAGARINILTVVAKAVCIAVARTPAVNSRWDAKAGEIVSFNYVNLGIAAATPRGLMVPNIKDADRMTLLELSAALTSLTEAARAGKSSPAELGGGTISITNIGVFGIDAGTPILNPGEAAILAMGAVRRMPWEHRGEIALRQVLTLSLSFDHRLVDGEQGSLFLADIGDILREPGTVLAMV